ncbi:Hypothetical predicted protein [Xyrichtys novacula]|uniref:Uncharacterized protein n=1 Tax=Xyrichtys novacula TaxID=13765 RepID=A0AAV1EYD0_XYRNO|nr:Hypothetical predicted protein [Xyrichtys novacula]
MDQVALPCGLQRVFPTTKDLTESLYNGSPQVQEKAPYQEEDDRGFGLAVHLSLLQPREVLRCQNGEEQKYWDNILHRLPGGVPDPHHLPVRAG